MCSLCDVCQEIFSERNVLFIHKDMNYSWIHAFIEHVKLSTYWYENQIYFWTLFLELDIFLLWLLYFVKKYVFQSKRFSIKNPVCTLTIFCLITIFDHALYYLFKDAEWFLNWFWFMLFHFLFETLSSNDMTNLGKEKKSVYSHNNVWSQESPPPRGVLFPWVQSLLHCN